MSTRTIIEINHDFLSRAQKDLQGLILALHGTDITLALNEGQPIYFSGIKILAQRHHTEGVTLTIGDREVIRL